MSETTQTYPSHHISDVDHWGGLPDRNYFTFVILSVVLGFFGIDHFYLRSFATGTQKFLINCFTFGLWYFWDIIQIVTEGKEIRQRGLNSPLDWIRGIGRGTFLPTEDHKRTDGKHNEAPKSYIIFAVLAIFFGWLGADKFYIGQPWQGVTKLISCFNIFLILFGWMWVIWDAVHVFFMTSTVLRNEAYNPLPFSWLFERPINGGDFLVKEVNDSPNALNKTPQMPTQMTCQFPSTNIALPELPAMPPLPNIPPLPSLNSIANALPKVNIGPSTKDGTNINIAIPSLSSLPTLSSILPSINIEPANKEGINIALPNVPKLPGLPPLPSLPALPTVKVESDATTGFNLDPPSLPTIKNIKAVTKNISRNVGSSLSALQKGGGSSSNPVEEPSGPGPIIAGALTAIIVAGGLKGTYDILCKHLG
jgi:TM2 domain-containing membrane protein YozV